MSAGASTNMGGGWKQALTADPRKTATLAILLVVLAVVGWRMLAKGGPAPASGAATAVPAIASGRTPDNVTSVRGPARTGLALAEWSRTPTAPLGRNLFAFRPDAFTLKWGVTDEGSEPGGFWIQLAKSMSLETDLKSRRQGIVDAVVADAAKLRLSTTMMGATPQAIINEQLVKEGDVVASFRVLKIGARGITVEREGIRLDIQMK